jgi:hypothetical protein
MSKFDLKSGYWQEEMDEESRQKTAFSCHRGKFEFNIMPFGLKNALWKFVFLYIDDIDLYLIAFGRKNCDLNLGIEYLAKVYSQILIM